MPIPILLIGAAAAVLLSGGKKRRKSLAGQSCDPQLDSPKGYMCDANGVLRTKAVEESQLETEDAPSSEDLGEFATEEEDVSLHENEETASVGLVDVQDEQSPSEMCEEFFQAIHVVPETAEELPINSVAVEQTAIPAMNMVLNDIANDAGLPIDPEFAGPLMVQEALNGLVPSCEWKYDADSGEFLYNDDTPITSEVGREVVFGLIGLSSRLIDAFNEPST